MLTNTCVNVMPAVAAKSLQIPIIWKITEIIHANEHTTEAIQMIGRYADWIIGISETAVAPFQEAGMGDKVTIISPTWEPATCTGPLGSSARTQSVRSSVSNHRRPVSVIFLHLYMMPKG
ncbi:hypothetical protein Q0F98_09020 [Paenibacillus amylolyticus]|nr:hypothetical protein Q0F98_09020 [Paenibacillus amylolyticus]